MSMSIQPYSTGPAITSGSIGQTSQNPNIAKYDSSSTPQDSCAKSCGSNDSVQSSPSEKIEQIFEQLIGLLKLLQQMEALFKSPEADNNGECGCGDNSGAKNSSGSSSQTSSPQIPNDESDNCPPKKLSHGNKSSPGSDSSGSSIKGSDEPTVSKFKTIDPGQGPKMTVDENGKFVFNEAVDDSFLPPDVRAGMKSAVDKNFELGFFQDYFSNKNDAYQYLVHMANLESARGTVLENSADAQNTGGGSAGYMHLHTTFGFKNNSWGSPLNTEGWSQQEVLGDYEKYTTLVMRSLDANYQHTGASGSQEDMSKSMAMWWTGTDKTSAGEYYLSALSAGAGVNHNTGSAYI